MCEGSLHFSSLVTLAIVVPIYLILSLIVYRFGLVPLACAIFTVDMLATVPFTADISAWYFGTALFALFSVVLLPCGAFITRSIRGGWVALPEASGQFRLRAFTTKGTKVH